MGSGSDAEHWDSPSAESEYTTESQSLFFNASLQANEKLTLFLDGWMTMSEASFGAFELGEPPEDLSSAYDLDFSQIQDYSDLEYTQLQLTVGGNFGLTEDTSLEGAVTWLDLTDDQAYVYGDLSGSLLFTQLGLRSRF